MPFQPGRSGNPAGRGVGEKLFRDALMLALKETDGDRLRLRRIADKLVENAMAGEIAAIREVADRIDGRVPQPLRGSDDGRRTVHGMAGSCIRRRTRGRRLRHLHGGQCMSDGKDE